MSKQDSVSCLASTCDADRFSQWTEHLLPVINTGSPLKTSPTHWRLHWIDHLVVVMVVVAFYSPVKILRKCSTNHSPPAILLSGDKLAQTSSTLQARLNTQLVAQLAEITSSTTCDKYRFTSEKRPTHWKPQWWDRPSFLTGPPLKSILCTKDCTADHLLCGR